MIVNSLPNIREQLRSFDFKTVFLSRGWNAPARAPFPLDVKGRLITCLPIAEQGGWEVLEVTEAPVADQPGVTAVSERALREAIDGAVTNLIHHHVLIFVDDERAETVWQFSATVGGKRLRRERRFNPTTPVEPLVSLLRGMEIPFEMLDDEGEVSVTAMNDRMARMGVFADKVSKKFYDILAKKRKDFDGFLAWVDEEKDRGWYVTALLNRLMFIYFIQQKGLMKGDAAYLRHRLEDCIRYEHNFYRDFFLPLCFCGFAKPWDERKKLGGHFDGIPYLNGGLFLPHDVEKKHGITPEAVEAGTLPVDITIPNEEFRKWLDFFDGYRWTLDEENIDNDREINPDILGYIFEKYINQKQMGAYYTKEDITGYICRNTIIPRLFDMLAAAGKKGARAVNPLPIGPHPNLLNDGKGISGGAGIERYIYPAVKTQQRLPTETDREYLARQQRFDVILRDFEDGKIAAVNDFITWNLDIEGMARDFIAGIQDAEVLRDFYFAGLRKITVLDPTCGSGAFLFAALKVLYPLYDACIRKMRDFHARETGDASIAVNWKGESAFSFAVEVTNQLEFLDTPINEQQAILDQFGAELASISEHDNVEYFIHKRIIVDNLFGVDIMEEAVEICKLRLFLKLIAHADAQPGKVNLGIEPLPDIDFNILCGNTLVGFATHEEARQAVLGGVQKTLQMDDTMERIEEKARAVDVLATAFRQAQTERNAHSTPEKKAELEKALRALEHELNGYLARQYDITSQESKKYAKWLESHQPFHWYVEFYGTMKRGGFDSIVGNPPYVVYSKVRREYEIRSYCTEPAGNLYAFVLEKSMRLAGYGSCIGMIVPIASVSTLGMVELQIQYLISTSAQWHAHFATRPGKLFGGVDMNLTISLLRMGCSETPAIYSTTYNRWWSSTNPQEDERASLFQCLSYCSLVVPSGHPNPYPKFGSEIELRILKKMHSKHRKLSGYYDLHGEKIYYHSGGRYWRKALRQSLSSHYKGICLQRGFDTVALALLNSQLFYWYWITNSNCMDVVSREVDALPIFCLNSITTSEFSKLVDELLAEYSDNQELRSRYGEIISTQEVNINVKVSKPIIDKIDRVLAKHYGFTDEELDFIINYDIKYRMGREGEGDSDG